MKIIEQTDSILVMQNGKIGALVFGFILTILFVYLLFYFWGTGKFWLPLIFILMPLALIIFSVTTTIFFNKSTGLMSIAENGIILNSTKEYKIENIKEVNDKEFWGFSTMSLTLKDDSNVLLHRTRSGVFWGGKNFHGFGLWKTADKLSKFLGVPFNYTYPGKN